jgi:superfamily II DNA or RNA helicase
MTYFSDNYSKINYPISSNESKGLRNAQIGAIHAIGSHFTLHSEEAALIIMPTGSGKTAVLNLSAYLLRAKRVLVISSSVMVRGQIVSEFATLKTLKESNVFHKDLALPKVKEVKSPIREKQEWKDYEAFDVVVGIPNSLNEGINERFKPEEDLFDIVLVDESHHVPAYTWTNVVEAFPSAKKIFFTATPFRRDKKEIDGRLCYNYPLSKAYEDKIFGDIGYYPVITKDPNPDLAIAKETEKIFNQDLEKGFIHVIMVRTETKDHAEVLSKLYAENTKLRLKKVDSTQTYRTITATINKLKAGELDGIICVDMLGEGFDFPNLKIAAIHSPKKSLANTLQFIGRFARTNAENIGEAKFLAIPNDIEIGKKRLYEEGAIWNDIIKDLSEGKIVEEDGVKKALDSFRNEIAPGNDEDISFFNLNPYCHVKVYRAQRVALDADIEISGQNIIYHSISEDLNAVVLITRESEKPKWILSDELINVKHYFYLIYFDEKSHLIFINSSIKTTQFYEDIANLFVIGNYERVSKYHINKVLIDIANPEFFNIGMANRSANSGESYRIITGPNAETTIKKSHGKNYANGHVFMKGISNNGNVTVGYSSGSKIWSNAYEKIPNFINWCQLLASKIVSNKEVKTNTAFDDLPIGQVVASFPLSGHSASWHGDTFSHLPFFDVLEDGELISQYQLLDFSIFLDRTTSNLNRLSINISNDDISIPLFYDFQHHFTYQIAPAQQFVVEVNNHHIEFIDYLNENPLQIFLEDFATIIDHEYFAPPKESDFQYDKSKITAFNWTSIPTDITKEFYNDIQQKAANGNQNSIQETIRAKLINDNYPIVIFDHGTGEIADFITFMEFPDRTEITLYHIKGSSGNQPGDRVGDVYEVCMQAVKSQAWTVNKQTFQSKVHNRVQGKPEKFLIGDINDFNILINKSKRLQFHFAIIQPGISEGTFTPKLSYILAAADDYISNNGYLPLVVIGS